MAFAARRADMFVRPCGIVYLSSIRESRVSSPKSSSTSKLKTRKRVYNGPSACTSSSKRLSMTTTTGRLICPKSSRNGSWSFRRESHGESCVLLDTPTHLVLLDTLLGSICPLVPSQIVDLRSISPLSAFAFDVFPPCLQLSSLLAL